MNELYSIRTVEDEDSFQHYGVTRMRWGVRRYQNRDGTLTKAGIKRYSNASPYEVKTVDGDVFHVSKNSTKNYNVRGMSKVTKTWGEHLREEDYKKLYKTERNAVHKKAITSAGYKFIAKML